MTLEHNAFSSHKNGVRSLADDDSRREIDEVDSVATVAEIWRVRLFAKQCAGVQVVHDINVSQGSVATCLRCGGIFNSHSIANFRPSVPVKK